MATSFARAAHTTPVPGQATSWPRARLLELGGQPEQGGLVAGLLLRSLHGDRGRRAFVSAAWSLCAGVLRIPG